MNKDYAAAIKQQLDAGVARDSSTIRDLETARALKIKDMYQSNPDQSTKFALDTSFYGTAPTVRKRLDGSTQANQMTYNVQDNTNMINQGFESQKQAVIQAIRDSISLAQMQKQRGIIDQPAQSQQIRNELDRQYFGSVPRVDERIANLGGNAGGGMSRQMMAEMESGRQQGLTAINLEEQRIITEANRAIEDLTVQGRIQEAQAVQAIASEQLKTLLTEAQRLDSLGFDMAKTNVTLQESATDRAVRINQFDRELMAKYDISDKEINARAAQTLAEITSREGMSKRDDDTRRFIADLEKELKEKDFALRATDSLGYVSDSFASILGVPAGTKTNDAKYKETVLQNEAKKLAVDEWYKKESLGVDWFNANTARLRAQDTGGDGLTYSQAQSEAKTQAQILADDWLKSITGIPGHNKHWNEDGTFYKGWNANQQPQFVARDKFSTQAGRDYYRKILISGGYSPADADKIINDKLRQGLGQ